MLLDEIISEGERIMTICNACRYCEGFCPVFPAMERRLTFAEADMNYLANLCHNCGECLRACQYEPPHPFDVNVPKTLAKIRVRSYEKYCWPQALGFGFRTHGIATVVGIASFLAACMAGFIRWIGNTPLMGSDDAANFYRVISHQAMAVGFGVVFLLIFAALVIGVRRYLKDTRGEAGPVQPDSILTGLRDALSLKYLHSSGAECTTQETIRSPWRRWFHHLTFYGFMLCFASTSVATMYHFIFDQPAPYPLLSLPVVLGTPGGIGLFIGPLGLWVIRGRSDPAVRDPNQRGLDRGFIVSLVLTSASGLALLALRETPAMRILLIVHLAVVMTLFITLPYGKFVHGLYRAAALIQYARECRIKKPIALRMPPLNSPADARADG
jgi:citrate/tricarballylate utilization protein